MEITLKYTLDEVNALLTALGQLPFNTSAGLISNIQLQATPQGLYLWGCLQLDIANETC